MRGGGVQYSGPAASADEEMHLGSIMRAIWRNKRSIVGPTVVMVAAAFIGVNLITPRFKSEARVLVEEVSANSLFGSRVDVLDPSELGHEAA